jgi:porphobilinogen synthase
MDGANLREAMREIALDLEEGADMILMKPAMPYLDVIRAARERLACPSAPIRSRASTPCCRPPSRKAGSTATAPSLESLLGIRRAGADFIVTYFAKDAARLLGCLRWGQSLAIRSQLIYA